MKIIAYSYTNPLFETAPDRTTWGWEVDEIYQDLGDRQQLGQLLQDSHTQPVNYLLIRQLEELGDSVEEVCDRLTKLESLNIKIIPIKSDIKINQDQTTSTQATKTDLLKLLNQIRQNQHSRKIRQAHARNRIKAIPPPGKAPYGYRRGKDRYTLDRSAAPVVKDFFESFLLFGSLRGAVRHIEKKYGKKISVTTGRRWLTNPVYRGDLQYQNGEVISNTHLPIISREEAAQVERLLRRNRRMPPRTASAPHSLAGLVICTECESPMITARVTTFRKDKEYLYLRPKSCPRKRKCKALAYQKILEQTIEIICRELPVAVAALEMPNMDGIKSKIKQNISEKQEILSQLPNLITNGIFDQETAELRTYKLKTEIAQLERQLNQLPPVNLLETAKAVSIPEFWWDLSESERRFYLREFISKIEIIRQDTSWHLQVIFIF
ncbi:MAG: recombinase family protein [Okeania sp. SIO2F4]|uniref:recombinase family protein n=1 Tax=Okeania sp. SIO2F4 TaxID=2607790 RepID=UPI00142D03BF|nr:recombinase family protein [Okeania sp. SIO2F4]NES03967.1 recombinase family protein [Okeania sp. SIO2F4]